MSNPKTTIVGYLVLAVAVLRAVIAALQGHYGDLGIQDILAGAAGVGLIAAKDGGH